MAAPAAFGDYETGKAELDEQVRVLLEELCDPEAPEEENLAAVYQWVCNEITYRAGTADVSGRIYGGIDTAAGAGRIEQA